MSRIWSAVVVFAVIIIVITTGFIFNTKSVDSVSEKVNSALAYSKSGDKENAKKNMESAVEEWNSKMNTMLLFMSHDKLDQIDESLNIADTYITSGDTAMFNAECKRTSILLQHFYDLVYPTVYNIF